MTNMRNLNLLLSTGVILSAVFCVSAPVLAEDSVATNCVTAGTKATYANMTARMEKDIAPYASEAKAADAVKAYRDAMTTAWAAMQEPYCGYGKYGIASAIHSYDKSVTRARSSFLTAVRSLPKVKAATVVPVAKETPVVSKDGKTTETVTVAIDNIPTGLRRGMRSAAILNLQKLLAKHFKDTDSSWLTGYFGPVTLKYVIKFQLDKKIVASKEAPGAGLVGPRTAAALNAM